MNCHHTRLARNLNDRCRLLLLSCRFVKVLDGIVCAFKPCFFIIYNTYTFNVIHRIDTLSHEVNPCTGITTIISLRISHLQFYVIEIEDITGFIS